MPDAADLHQRAFGRGDCVLNGPELNRSARRSSFPGAARSRKRGRVSLLDAPLLGRTSEWLAFTPAALAALNQAWAHTDRRQALFDKRCDSLRRPH